MSDWRHNLVEADEEVVALAAACKHNLHVLRGMMRTVNLLEKPGAFLELEYLIDDLLGRLARDHPAALGTVRNTDAGVQQAEIVVNLRHRADGRARVAARRFLIDRDGR